MRRNATHHIHLHAQMYNKQTTEFGSELTHARFNGIIMAWVRAECLHVFWFKMVWYFIIIITTAVGSCCCCCCWHFGTVVSLSLSLEMPIWMSMLQNQTNGLFYRWINSLRAPLNKITHTRTRTHTVIVCERETKLISCVCDMHLLWVYWFRFLFSLFPLFPTALAACFTYFSVYPSIRLEIAHLDTRTQFFFIFCHFNRISVVMWKLLLKWDRIDGMTKHGFCSAEISISFDLAFLQLFCMIPLSIAAVFCAIRIFVFGYEQQHEHECGMKKLQIQV